MTIAWFDDPTLDDIALVGGKGTNLGKMARAGLPVPPGFCVTTEAYQQFIAEMGLWAEMNLMLTRYAPREAGNGIRQLLEGAKMPESISKSIRDAYIQLNKGQAPVAVRSSATAEDLEDASFAGQQDSYLGIRGVDNLNLHVQRCWGSLWTERAIAYRERNQFPHEQVSLAVVVQEMVASDVAGVLFTANPINNQPNEMLINAAYGLGESVVSGRVTPDTFRVERKHFRVLEQSRGEKASRIDMDEVSGTLERETPAIERERLSLSNAELRELKELGEQVEAYYGAPQDIEWAIVNKKLYLLQTRPITSLATAITPAQKISGTQHAILNDLLEHYPDPPYPLDYAAVTDSYQQLVDSLGEFGISLPPADQIILLDDAGLPSANPPSPHFNRRILGLVGSLRKRLKADPNLWMTQEFALFQQELAELKSVDVSKLDNRALSAFIQKAVALTSRIGAIRFRDYIIPAIARSAYLNILLGFTKTGKKLNVMDLLGNLPYKTAQIDQALHQLAAEAKRFPDVKRILTETALDKIVPLMEKDGQVVLEKVQEFLDAHGARTMKMYLPFSNRSWAEQPATLLATIGVLLRSDKVHPERADQYETLREKILDELPKPLHNTFSVTLEKFRVGHIARESTLYTIEEGFLQARRGIDETAKRLPSVDEKEIIYLTLPEVYALLEDKMQGADALQFIQRREKARPQALQNWRGKWQQKRKPSADGDALTGLPGSSGYAEGTVKVINGPAEFDKLEEGDVLVCPFTDPAWTPLFTLASAVVSDTGGPLSHAAIVAREYGIPAVLGTQIATAQFKDDDVVSVDGGNGEVRMLNSFGK